MEKSNLVLRVYRNFAHVLDTQWEPMKPKNLRNGKLSVSDMYLIPTHV